MSKTVAVAMSGGVDSSVAALILKQEGYDVVGITMRIWECGQDTGENTASKKLCCSLTDMQDAKQVADKLKIPHYVLDFRKQFNKEIIMPFVDSYSKGITPNPCVMCNKKVKFDILLNKVLSMNINYLVTGHFAKIGFDRHLKQFVLKRGKDRTIDQSYWLYNLTQKQMENILLPLGGYTKAGVRQLAKKASLPVADKPKSQEICFIQSGDYHEFIKDNKAGSPNCFIPGLIKDVNGKILGNHKGIAFYTVGQRRGLGIPAGKPIYVKSIDAKNNIIIAGDYSQCLSEKLIVKDINLINTGIKFPVNAKVKIRFKHEGTDAVIDKIDNNAVQVKLNMPQFAVTPGQSAVFYQGDTVIGGGVIQ